MTGPKGALTVRVNDGFTDRHVTAAVSNLRWTKMINAGHQSLSFRMTLPHVTFTDLGPQDRAYVYDARTARCLFDSYIENPTPVDGLGGQSFDISAVGGVALANDETRALIYITQALDDYERATDTTSSANVESGSQIADVDYAGVQRQFPNGSLAIQTGWLASAGNWAMQRANMTLGAIHAVVLGGKTDANWASELINTAGVITTGPLGPGPTSFDLYVGGGTGLDLIPPGTEVFAFRLRRTGAPTNVADEDTWLRMAGLYVLGRRMDRTGTLLTGAAEMGADIGVTASQVVEDLLGRLLTFCDPATATVETTDFLIDQLAFTDGAKAADVLTSLGKWEADCWWGIGAAGANGLHEFTYQRWATEPRYVVSVKDGWRQTGSDVDLCNRISVSWTDAAGKTQVTTVTAADLITAGLIDASQVAALGSRIKDAEPVSLPDGFGSAANATQVGTAALLDKIAPPRAGTVTVRRPIVDRLTGNTVMPWELEPGWPVLVREPGHTIRCTQVDYDDETVSALLTLGTPPQTTEQRAARLSRAA